MLVGGADLELLQVAAIGMCARSLAGGLLGLDGVGIAHGWGVSPVVCVMGVEAAGTLLWSPRERHQTQETKPCATPEHSTSPLPSARPSRRVRSPSSRRG